MADLTFNKTRLMQTVWDRVLGAVRNIPAGAVFAVLFLSILFASLPAPPFGDLVETDGGWGFPRPVYVLVWTYKGLGDTSYFQWSSLFFDLFFWMVFFSLAGLAVKAVAQKIGVRIRPLYIFCIIGSLTGVLYVFAVRPVRIINVETGGFLSCLESRAEQIDMATEYGDLETLQSLFKNHPELVFSKDSDGQTPFHRAAYWGDAEIVKFLLANKADVGVRDSNGLTPLFYSADGGWTRATELLLKNGADVNAKSHSGGTPLFDPTASGYYSEVKLLLENGAKVDAKSGTDGDTVLHFAALCGHPDVVQLLIAHHADVNAENSLGNTPLHQAAQYGQEEVVKLFLANNANVNAKNKDGWTPLRLAAGYTNIVELLRQHGATNN